ncbi:hypothetical protein TURU_127888 [Turdus rufiventris]|nr:hypothetical protein TURU_127888 [Turdus rufiventris]
MGTSDAARSSLRSTKKDYQALEAAARDSGTQGYDLTGITEMWWSGFCDWNIGMERYRLFGKNRYGWPGGGGVVLSVNDQLECMEFGLGVNELAKSFLLRIKGVQ